MITKLKIKNFIKILRFANITTRISILFATIPSLFCFFTFLPENKWYGLLFFIPTVIIAILSYLSNIYKNKYANILKILVTLLNLFILLVIQTICAFGILLICIQSDTYSVINQPKHYSLVLKTLDNDPKITHFPKSLPNKAKNIVLFKKSFIRGGDVVYLRFITSKEYIKNEVKKHHYIRIEGPFEDAKKYQSNYPREWIFYEEQNSLNNKEYQDKIEGYKIYVIGDKILKNGNTLCEYGIAVNDTTGTIIYYASNPD